MPRTPHFALAGAAVLLLGACAATTRQAPVDVSRYHLGAPIPGGTVSIEPLVGAPPAGPEFRTYADPVGAELTRLGYAVATDPSSTYIANVSLTRSIRGTVRDRPPVSVGLGGGSYGRGGGIGGGFSFGIGGKRHNIIVSDLALHLKRRSDDTVVWEGHAVTEALEGTPADQSAPIAARLAHALFQGFPGESGVTITVR